MCRIAFGLEISIEPASMLDVEFTVYAPESPRRTSLDMAGTVPASQLGPMFQLPLTGLSQECVGAPALAISVVIETAAIAPCVRVREFSMCCPFSRL